MHRSQGVLGIKVRIMKEWDPTGKVGPRTPLPDVVTVLAPKVWVFIVAVAQCRAMQQLSVCTPAHPSQMLTGGGLRVGQAGQGQALTAWPLQDVF